MPVLLYFINRFQPLLLLLCLFTNAQDCSFSLSDVSVCADNTPAILVGPNGNYIYEWSNGSNTQNIQISESGDYWLTIIDSLNCTYTDTATVTVSENPIFEMPDIVSCTNGAPITICLPDELFTEWVIAGITWSTGGPHSQCVQTNSIGINTLSPIVTNSLGCSYTDEFTVTLYEAPEFELQDIIKCANETINLTGPDGDYFYEWNTGATTKDLAIADPGDYTLTITDSNGCQFTQTSIVSDFSFELTDITICEEQAPVVLSGPSGMASYEWSTGETEQYIPAIISGEYWLMVTNSDGCTAIDTLTLTIFPDPDLGFEDLEICEDDLPYLFEVSDEYIEYIWSDGSEGNTIEITTAGELSLMVTDVFGCDNTETMNITILEQDAIACQTSSYNEFVDSDCKLGLYPTLAKENITLVAPSCCKTENTIQIFDVQGRILQQIKTDFSETTVIPVEQFKKGQYFVKVDCGNKVFSELFIKQ